MRAHTCCEQKQWALASTSTPKHRNPCRNRTQQGEYAVSILEREGQVWHAHHSKKGACKAAHRLQLWEMFCFIQCGLMSGVRTSPANLQRYGNGDVHADSALSASGGSQGPPWRTRREAHLSSFSLLGYSTGYLIPRGR